MRILSFIFVLLFGINVSAQQSAMRWFNEGTKLANVGEFAGALSSYRAALNDAERERSDNDFLARVHYNLGVCQYQLNHPESAIEEFHLAIKLKGGRYSRAFYALGMAESARKNWPGARMAFLETLRLDGTNGEAWFDLAFAYFQEGNLANAEAAFRNSIIHKSIDSAWSHNNVGVFLALRDEFSSAEKQFETALKSSGGRLLQARNNLEYCRARKREHLGLVARTGLESKGKDE
jgi:Tfp pilus assembly protein PilF